MVAIVLQETNLSSGMSKEPHQYNGDNLSIGRLKDKNDVVVDHPCVSRKHAVLLHNGNGWFVFDESSSSTHIIRGSQFIPVPKLPSNFQNCVNWQQLLSGDQLVLAKVVVLKVNYN